jgi:hypothetical protein
MILQLQPRPDSMLSHAYPACAFRGFNCPRLRLLAHAKITPKLIRCNQPALPTHSPNANQRPTALQKQRTRIQRP